MDKSNNVKWGIIGCGNIAHKFAHDLALVSNVTLAAVASRNLEKAQEFAKKHHSIKAYDSYEQLISDPSVDIIYIATPHTSHAEISIKAMENKKHVLCEKPLALNSKDASAIISKSIETECFFMEALWTRFNPTFKAIKKCIEENEIGDVKYINADFSFLSEKSLDSRVLNVRLGGGSILDIGIYPVFLAYSLLGIPANILAATLFHEVTSCDMQTSMIFSYKDAQAMLYSGFVSKAPLEAKISGSNGQIHIEEPWHAASGYTITKGNDVKKVNLPIVGLGYTYEIEECHKCLNNSLTESSLWSHQNSLDLISILDEVRQLTKVKYPQES